MATTMNLLLTMLVFQGISGYIVTFIHSFLYSPASKVHFANQEFEGLRAAIKNGPKKDSEKFKSHVNLTFLLLVLGYSTLEIYNEVSTMPPTFYDLLRVDPTSSVADIKASFRKMSLNLHPDKNVGKEEEYLLVRKAYEVISEEIPAEVYSKFGAEAFASCPQCLTFREHLLRSLPALIFSHLFSVGFMLFIDFVAGKSRGRFWIIAFSLFFFAIELNLLVKKRGDLSYPLSTFTVFQLRKLLSIVYTNMVLVINPFINVLSPPDNREMRATLVDLAEMLRLERRLRFTTTAATTTTATEAQEPSEQPQEASRAQKKPQLKRGAK